MTSLKFGTSGLRGLAVELAAEPAGAYTAAFLSHLKAIGEFETGMPVAIGMDLRKTSPDIAAWCCAAIEAADGRPINLGLLPTPALALWCMEHQRPGIMITGSHIPDDRNGLKFYRATGEITKDDEEAIVAAHGALSNGNTTPITLPEVDGEALSTYAARYAEPFKGALKGLHVGLYQHSTVGRDVMRAILEAAGAKVLPLGRSEKFIPVDTEALRPEDVSSLNVWAGENDLAAIVSADGDADRPLIADEKGTFVPGDTVGAITARHLGADCIVTPVTSNSALEAQLDGIAVVRTRVGSPYVLEAMEAAKASHANVIGFEANGGVLLGSDVATKGSTLAALPTRDSMLPILSTLAAAAAARKPLSTIVAKLALNAKHSDRVTDYPRETSDAFIAALDEGTGPLRNAVRAFSTTPEVDATDGYKLISGRKSLHFRPSGNAPELRIYCEAETQAAAVSQVKKWQELALKFAGRSAG